MIRSNNDTVIQISLGWEFIKNWIQLVLLLVPIEMREVVQLQGVPRNMTVGE